VVLEAIELRHQIAVLERGRARRPCFRRWNRLLWILLSRWWSFCEQCGARLETLCPSCVVSWLIVRGGQDEILALSFSV